MIKRFCNRCGQIYDSDAGPCNCKASVEARKNWRKQYDTTKRDTWYNNKHWRAVSRFVRARDYNLDRLQQYIQKKERKTPSDRLQVAGWYKQLRDYLIDEDGQIRRVSERVLVHHIVPREDDTKRWYDLTNLITLSDETHELVHKLYRTQDKEAVQQLLLDAVQCEL